ncbi:MAG: hypothetical protein U0694_06320 [Anaerolineae bacterium]
MPEEWVKRGGVFIPMYQREGDVDSLRRATLETERGESGYEQVNAVSGKAWEQQLNKDKEEDYLVCPPQPWLDGINAGDGFIKQFVAMPLGHGLYRRGTGHGQRRCRRRDHGLRSEEGKFPDQPPQPDERMRGITFAAAAPAARIKHMAKGGVEMGLGAGGKMKQKIYPDPHGLDTVGRG